MASEECGKDRDRDRDWRESQFKNALLNLAADIASNRTRADALYSSTQRIEAKVWVGSGDFEFLFWYVNSVVIFFNFNTILCDTCQSSLNLPLCLSVRLLFVSLPPSFCLSSFPLRPSLALRLLTQKCT
jgi:hypothetical protein